MGAGILPIIAIACLFGGITADPYDEFRSTFEFRETNLDNPNYRLTNSVQPTYQYVDLDVYLDEYRFNGMTRIEVNVLVNDLRQMVLHQRVVAIQSVTVLDANNQAVPLAFPNIFETDDYYEILMINFAEPIASGSYTIIINYLGRINDNPLDRGLYMGYYFLNGEQRLYATTQFQPYHARKAFPCFDEPQFKNRFVIAITRSNQLSQSYSNMAINTTTVVAPGRIREEFLPTPVVSAYLVAFHISDFVATNSTGTSARPFGVISRPGGSAVLNQHNYAADMGFRITEWMSEYFGIDYYQMGQGVPMKNDHIALPDFPSGAMENWGMVNYREAYLLYDPDNTNLINQIFIGTILSHELAHKWFGNLVTCFWWSNLWLNESYASFFEYFATHGADPSLELDDQFVVDYVHSALSADAGAGIQPMNWTTVASNPSITSHFSTSSYAKGASVLRTMEHLVTPATFRKALNIYLVNNSYGLGTPEDMYNAFRQAALEDQTMTMYPGVDVGEVFDAYVQNPGAPVVNVNIDYSTGVISLEQERFQLTGDAPDHLWQIPLTWTRQNAIDFENTKPTYVLRTRTATLNKPPGHEWVIFNVAQSGYYRVNYDDHSWEMIAAALRNNRESIHKLNRAQIVNDVLFFLRSGSISVERAFDVLSFLQNETDYYVWVAALGQLDWQRRRTLHLPALNAEFERYLLESMEAVIENLGYNEAVTGFTSVILNRIQILNFACNILGHEGCIQDSVAKWNDFRNNQTPVPKNLRRHVYCVGLREGDATDFNFLWNQYLTSENTADMVVILRALACTRDQGLINTYLQNSMNSDMIRIHDKTNAFSFALLGNPENLPTVLNFVYNNYNEIRSTYGGSARLVIALNALSTYLTDFDDIVAFQTWLYNNQLNLESNEFAAGNGVINAAINNLNWSNNVALDVLSYLRSRNSAGTFAAPLALICAALIAQLMH